MNSSPLTVYTVGHSNHSIEQFLSLLKGSGVTAIADVRSSPYSRYSSQFNREALKAALKAEGIAYVFLGRELGARSEDPSCYDNGRVLYGCLAQSDLFGQGLERVLSGARSYRVALMCAEKDPITCHRTILVARELQNRGIKVVHVLEDGSLESQEASVERLLSLFDLQEEDLFLTREERIEEAYRLQEERIAYVNPEMVEV